MNRRGRGAGFALVELLIVLCILSVLLRMAVPAMANFRRNAVASRAAGDLNTIRAAAVAQYVGTGAYAPDAVPGAVPAGMEPFLPREYSFTRPQYELDWDHYTFGDSLAGGVSGELVALTVTAPDSLTGYAILRTLGANCTHWSMANSHSFVIFSTLESPF